MSADDEIDVCLEWPSAKIIAIPMEVINHCHLTRAEMRRRLELETLITQVLIPERGNIITLWQP